MWLHVVTTAWSSSSLLNTKRQELQFQGQMWDQIDVSVFGGTKRMSGKILKTNKMFAALVVKFVSVVACCLYQILLV